MKSEEREIKKWRIDEGVTEFKYVGSTVDARRDGGEIKQRVEEFKRKWKLHKTVLRPTVMCGADP